MYFLLLACGTPTLIESPTSVEKNTVVPTETTSLVTQLSARDSQLDCTQLPTTELRTELISIVDTVERPPWVPMRAAACLAELFPAESQEDLLRWIATPDKKGLAFLIAGQLPKLPDDIAKNVAQAGLNGPHAQEIRLRITKQNDPRLAPLLEVP